MEYDSNNNRQNDIAIAKINGQIICKKLYLKSKWLCYIIWKCEYIKYIFLKCPTVLS